MKKTNRCGKCEGSEILQNVMIADRFDGNLEAPLQLRVDFKPDAFMFKESKRSEIVAFVCMKCGFTELYTTSPQNLSKDSK